jgi:hypothetical protein
MEVTVDTPQPSSWKQCAVSGFSCAVGTLAVIASLSSGAELAGNLLVNGSFAAAFRARVRASDGARARHF